MEDVIKHIDEELKHRFQEVLKDVKEEAERHLTDAVKNLREEVRVLVHEAKDEAQGNLLEMINMLEKKFVMVTGDLEKHKQEMQSALNQMEISLKGLKEALLKLMNELNDKAKEEMEKMIKMVTEAMHKAMQKEMQNLLDQMESKLRKEMDAKIKKITLIFLFVLLPICIICICVRAF